MEILFSSKQLDDPEMRDCATAIRKCVHCGFCQATCPTYVVRGDELDSPRGRIMLMKSMLEEQRPATEREVRHIDRCLSCLACTSTCPSGVNYMHLIDKSRAWVEETYKRNIADRSLRSMLAWLLPKPTIFRIALHLAIIFRPISRFMPKRIQAILRLAPKHILPPSVIATPQTFSATGKRVRRVALLTGCAQPVLAPHINEATIEILQRSGCEVVIPKSMGCCGALNHHMGKVEAAHAAARVNIDAWWNEHMHSPLDAVIVNASGCGTTVKDYGRLLQEDLHYADKAEQLAAITMDITELLEQLTLPVENELNEHRNLKVTYHAACSLQHGQKIRQTPKRLLEQAGYSVSEPKESHLCCGSAGTYNILQPEMAETLKLRKLKTIADTAPQVIATGNIGCITQLGQQEHTPVVHTVELLNWASGGKKPEVLKTLK